MGRSGTALILGLSTWHSCDNFFGQKKTRESNSREISVWNQCFGPAATTVIEGNVLRIGVRGITSGKTTGTS